ncbi:MAG TPA: beta-glucosidase BglX [Terriglobales bacterium]|nr:beta-glucosidase BglX [Terriglobales bacterium]
MSRIKLQRAFAAFVIAVLCACTHPALVAQTSTEHRVNELLRKMTLEEKIGQLNQINQGMPTGTIVNGNPVTLNVEQAVAEGRIGSMLNVTGAAETNRLQKIAMEKSRLKIPLLFGLDVIHGYRTIFPIPLALASSWDPKAIELSSEIAAREATAAGIRWTFAPMVDVARDPRWGRIAEGAGEDQFLGAEIARAYVRGFQGNLNSPDRMAACAKHYVAYGAAEAGRDYNSVDLSERKLREVYLPPFKAAAEAGAMTFMSSFNTLGGIPASANEFTLRKILKGEWGFKGFVVSDWNSVGELIPHGVAADGSEAARLALNSGVDMDMCSGEYVRHVAQLVKAGKIPQAVVDDAVRRILRVKFELGLFDRPYTNDAREKSEILTPANLQAARSIAQKTVVLLKNDKNLLPLSKSVSKLALIGPLADSKTDMLGNWIGMGKAEDAVTILEGIKAKLPSAEIVVSKGVDVLEGTDLGIAEAVAAARSADVAILVLGEKGTMSGEAASRASIDLPGKQRQLLQAVLETGKPVVLVLMTGRPLALAWEAERVPAIVEAWFPGVQGGNAVADVLFGDVNPSGRLPVSFPRSLGQVPLYYSELSTGRPLVDPKATYQSMYLDSPNTPLFPFGYGLSYTTFAYSNLKLSSDKLTKEGKIKVSADVENTGARAGDEIVQLYIRDLVASVARPVKELKGFQRVSLNPGEKKTIEFSITPAQLAFWNAEMKLAAEPGKFKVWVGPNSAEGLEGGFELTE